MKKLVILDRDGVINEDSAHYIKSLDEWRPIEGSMEAIANLYRHGFTVVVATNQSGLARGLIDPDDLETIHTRLREQVEDAGGRIEAVFYCPHGPADLCNCRKPKPGLIDAIEAELGISSRGAPLVGDSLRDLQAGIAKGCVPILVRTGNGEATLKRLAAEPEPELTELRVFDHLKHAANYIVDNF